LLPTLFVRRFYHSFVVQADIDRVWEFYTGTNHLEVITPPQIRLNIDRSTTGSRLEEGTEVWLSGHFIKTIKWHSKITKMQPYVYVDEMLQGLFKTWIHTHTFRAADTGTEVVDEIDFELPYGALGRIFEGYAAAKLAEIFAHRKEATASYFFK
jgi:ligand-binding SRPBCC domain-containing protein